MYICNCGKEFEKSQSYNSHCSKCKIHIKILKPSIYKKDDIYICECGKEFIKSQSLNSHFSHCLIHRKGEPEKPRGGNKNWSKGLTKETDKRVKSQNDSWKASVIAGTYVPTFLNKHHTLETKQQMSKSASETNNGYVKTRYYEIFCPHDNKNVKVQGTWELKYAEYLNKNKINWARPKTRILYTLFDGDYSHSYFADFYLPESDTFIEIKGHWWKSKDGRVDDKRKMKCVLEQNQDKNIIILTLSELKVLNIL